ncbi:24675_t:CDS:2 [Racocetra persica]|uniref:24675_t:CDS:1 n=1 Tax=Racocetra persica TaxID=160502 RepID=A0ACA9M6G9_9GLOM|nr:24675_t:CDS:2 [Racocetra persica]
MFTFAYSLHVLLRPKIDILNNSKESSTNMFTSLDTAYLAIYMMLTVNKIQNDKWDDDTIEAPFLSNSLLKMLGKAELTPKLVEKEVFQKLEESENLIQELKNIFEIKIE